MHPRHISILVPLKPQDDAAGQLESINKLCQRTTHYLADHVQIIGGIGRSCFSGNGPSLMVLID
jgi:hypothetical protein